MKIIYNNYDIFFDETNIGMTNLETSNKYYGSLELPTIELIEAAFRGLQPHILITIDQDTLTTIKLNVINKEDIYSFTLNKVEIFPSKKYQQAILELAEENKTLREEITKLSKLTSAIISENKSLREELEEQYEDFTTKLETIKKTPKHSQYFTFLPNCPAIPTFITTIHFVETIGPQFPISCQSCNFKVSREDFLERFCIKIRANKYNEWHMNNMTTLVNHKCNWCSCTESNGDYKFYSTLNDYLDTIKPRYHNYETHTYAAEDLFDIELALDHPVLVTNLSELSITHSDNECDMSYLQDFINLKKLKLQLPYLTTIQWIKELKELTELDLEGCTSLKNINVCSKLPKLVKINICNTGVKSHSIDCKTTGIEIIGDVEYISKSKSTP